MSQSYPHRLTDQTPASLAWSIGGSLETRLSFEYTAHCKGRAAHPRFVKAIRIAQLHEVIDQRDPIKHASPGRGLRAITLKRLPDTAMPLTANGEQASW